MQSSGQKSPRLSFSSLQEPLSYRSPHDQRRPLADFTKSASSDDVSSHAFGMHALVLRYCHDRSWAALPRMCPATRSSHPRPRLPTWHPRCPLPAHPRSVQCVATTLKADHPSGLRIRGRRRRERHAAAQAPWVLSASLTPHY